MEIQQLDFENWVQSYLKPRFPELIPIIENEHLAFRKIVENGRIDQDLLKIVVNAAYSQSSILAQCASDDLATLIGRHSEIKDVILLMSQDKRWYVRFNSILCLSSKTPLSFSVGIITKLIKDKSTKVRIKAADWAFRLNLIETIPMLEAQYALEKNGKVKLNLKFSIDLMKDGYHLEEILPDEFSLAIKIHDHLAIRSFPRHELENKGISSIIERIKATDGY